MIGIRLLICISPLLCCISCVAAQPAKGNTLSKKEQKAFAEARSAFDLGGYTDAESILERLVSNNPTVPDLHYLQALTYRELGEYQKALNAIHSGEAFDASPSPTVFLQKGQLNALLGNFDKSLADYKAYQNAIGANASPSRKNKAEGLVRQAKTAAEIAANPVPFRANPLTGGVNTELHLEYFPSLSADGKSMIFTRRVNRQNEDFYRSNLLEDGSWSPAVPLSGVNSEFNEGAQSISADGNYLVFTVCERPENRGSCDLYYTRKVEGGWTQPRSLGRNINTDADESQPGLSADGRLLFFSSNRAGGWGGKDLYVSGKISEEKWSDPVNLGNTINTPGNEQYPFWAADGQTLFFTSDRHPGLGGEDLFRSALSPQNTWETPVNLGYPINTAENETNLYIGLNGSTAFFSKRYVIPGSGITDVDIYSFELPQELRPLPATYLQATVLDAATGNALIATVMLAPLAGDTPPASFTTGKDGSFLTVLPAGKDYALTVDLPGYIFYSERFELSGELFPDQPFQLTIELQPVEEAIVADNNEENGATVFRNVLFKTGSATLLPVSGQELNLLVNLLKDNPKLNVLIAGHTDDIGEESDNQRLSEARAEAVATYLSEQGIEASRISTVGYGESRPVASNATPEGRAKNRRTTFWLH